MEGRDRNCFAYVIKQFPKRSEKFISREVLSLKKHLGPVLVFSLIHGEYKAESVPQVKVVYIDRFSLLKRILRQFYTFLQNPLVYLSLLFVEVIYPMLKLFLKKMTPKRKRRFKKKAKQFFNAGIIAFESRKNKIAHIHAHYANLPAETTLIASKLSGIPFSFTAHAKDLYLAKDSELDRLVREAAFVLTCTLHGESHLRNMCRPEYHDKIHCVYHGIDTGRFSPAGRNGGRKIPLIVSAARFTEKKGIDVLLQSLSILKGKNVPFRCILAGDGKLSGKIKEMISELNLCDCVELPGFLPEEDLIKCYHKANIFALASRELPSGDRDGVPNVILEAMACELPIVSTNVGGIPEVVGNGKNGFIEGEDSAQSFADSLEKLIRDERLRKQMGREGRKVILEKFDIVKNTERLFNLFQKYADKKPPTSEQNQKMSKSFSLPASSEVVGKINLRKKVGYILKVFPRMSETFILNEILELEALGFSVTIFTREQPSSFPIHEDFLRVKGDIFLLDVRRPADWLPTFIDNTITLFLKPRSYLRTFLWVLKKRSRTLLGKFFVAGRISRFVHQKKIEHIHAHFAISNTKLAEIVSMICGVEHSFTAHARDIWARSTISEVKKMIDSAKFVVTICKYNRDYLVDLADTPEKVHLIYNGLDLNKFKVRAKPAGSSNGCCEILSVGRLIPKKGFHILVDACKKLREENIQFKCRIVGYGPSYDDLRKSILKNALTDVCNLEGVCSQEVLLEKYLSRADIFIMPSIICPDGDRDGIPTVILEAMSLGIPVVATSVAGIPEVVIDRKTGILIPPESSTDLVQAVKELMVSETLCEKLGSQGAEEVRKMFDRRKNVRKLAHLFEGEAT